jgi:23S rRNA (adenine1618-N6)-methyltransferase
VIKLRLQPTAMQIFEEVTFIGETFDISICNPPFHASAAEACAGTIRKNKNLGLKTKALNFGGKSNELWCPGGEVAFITQMIKESVHVDCKWFTTLVSKESNLPGIYRGLEKIKPKQVRTLDMCQGQKKSRIIAWSFLQ